MVERRLLVAPAGLFLSLVDDRVVRRVAEGSRPARPNGQINASTLYSCTLLVRFGTKGGLSEIEGVAVQPGRLPSHRPFILNRATAFLCILV
jgi:hypothetical protein